MPERSRRVGNVAHEIDADCAVADVARRHVGEGDEALVVIGQGQRSPFPVGGVEAAQRIAFFAAARVGEPGVADALGAGQQRAVERWLAQFEAQAFLHRHFP